MADKIRLGLLALEAGFSAAFDVLLGRSRHEDAHTHTLLREIYEVAADTKTIIAKLQADMAVQTTVIGGFSTFTQTLQKTIADQKAAAIERGDSDQAVADLEALDDIVNHNTATLAALTSGTVAANEPIPEVPPASVTTTTTVSTTDSDQPGGATTSQDPPSSGTVGGAPLAA